MRTIVRCAARGAVLAFCLSGCATTPTSASGPRQAAAAETAPEPKTTAGAATSSDSTADVGVGQKLVTDGASGVSAKEEDGTRTDWIRKPSRPPADLITGPNLVYVFNFKESDVGRVAKERCVEQVGDGGRELSACLEKARAKVPVESVRFVKKPSGELWWITYNRYKGNLLKWHSVQFQPGAETADRITLNLVGKDKGIAPMARVPRSLLIELPNDYTIIVNDPEHGPMTYDAKIGTMENE